MDTSNASELPPGDELGGNEVVVLKADMPGNMDENVSSVVGISGSSENRKGQQVNRGKGARTTRGGGRRKKKEGDEAWGVSKRQRRIQVNKDIQEMDIPNNDPTQVAIPEREKGNLNPDVIKTYRLTFNEVIWPDLVHQYGWRLEAGNRPSDSNSYGILKLIAHKQHRSYFVPKGVERGRKGYKNRLHFFDSSKQVIEKLLSEECIYEKTLDDAWRASHVKKAMKVLADRDKKKVGDQFQVDPSMLSKWPSASSFSPPITEKDKEEVYSEENDAADLLYSVVWRPSTEDNQEALSAFLKDDADTLSEDQLLIAVESNDHDLVKASEAVRKFAVNLGKTGVDGVSLDPWGDEEAMKYSNLMVIHLKYFGKVANSMPNRTLGEVMHRYYACWKKQSPSLVSKEGESVEEKQAGEQPLKGAVGGSTAAASVLTDEIQNETILDNTVACDDELAKEEGKGEGDKVVEERRLQFNDETTTTTSAVWQSKSEVKGEEGTNSTTSQDVTEEEKKERPQSDVLLPLLTPNKEIGVLLKEESANIAISASQAPQAYHPLNPPTSSPFNRRFVIVPDEEFLAHKAAHTKATATEESAAATQVTPKKPPPISVSVSPSAEDGEKGDAAVASSPIPPVLFFVKESEAKSYTKQYMDLKIAVREDRILKEKAEIQNILNDDFCYKCQIDSVLDLLCCDGCPRTYHLTCVDLKEVPQGDWMCDVCLGLKDPEEEPIGVRRHIKCTVNHAEPVGLVQPTPTVPTRRGPNRSARRNGAYSEEPDGGMLLELALNPPPLPLSTSESVHDSRPVVGPMPLEDDVAGKGKSALPAVVLDLPPSSPTLSPGPRYQGQVV